MKLGHQQGLQQKFSCWQLLSLCRDQAMQNLLPRISRAANARSVLLHGESGTGKEVVARALHEVGNRRNQDLVIVHCGSVSTELMTSALFGHEKGAFTGAHELRKGASETADGGTVYLDEVGRLQLDVQGMLLRALEGEEFNRLGSTRPITSDFNLIAATNRDLRTMVKENRFAEDLYQRLNAIPLRIPPLRERREDVVRLARLFAEQAGKTLDTGAETALEGRVWTGNVRELRNLIERASTFCDTDTIMANDLEFDEILCSDLDKARALGDEIPEGAVDDISGIPPEERDKLLRIMETFVESAGKVCKDGLLNAITEEMLIRATLHRTGGNKIKTAKILGLGRQTVYNKMLLYGIPLK